jgi:hypothetical protein
MEAGKDLEAGVPVGGQSRKRAEKKMMEKTMTITPNSTAQITKKLLGKL